MAETIALADGHDALEHDEHAGAGLPRREQTRATRVALHGAEARDARDFGFVEHREHLVAPRRQIDLGIRRQVGAGTVGHRRLQTAGGTH